MMGELRENGPRWWPLVAIVALCACAFGYILVTGDLHRQGVVMASFGVFAIGVFFALIWLLAFSRFRWKIRLGVFAAIAVFGIGIGAQFRVAGFSGDLIPILEWRWAQGGSEAAADDSLALGLEVDHGISDTIGYSQFLGPTRNAKLPDAGLIRNWENNPPEMLWRNSIGEAWSAFATRGRFAVTQEQAGDFERVVCYDLLTGIEIWEHRDAGRYESSLGGVGPRATPTIEEGRVYTMGGTGILNCLELGTGNVVWRRDTLDENDAPLPDWGMAGSPLIHRDVAIVSVGGKEGRSLIAYDKLSGAEKWSSGSDATHWSSPVSYRIGNLDQIVNFGANAVVGYDANEGTELWRYPWKSDHPHVCIPVLLPDDRILISSGYGNGSALLRIAKSEDGTFSSELVWKSLHLKAKFTNVVYENGYIYGLDDGILVCIDVETGKRSWKKGRYGHGQVILVGDLLVVTSESGEVALVEATPDSYRERARFQALEGKSWNPPALVGPYLLLRNHLEAACYRLPVADS